MVIKKYVLFCKQIRNPVHGLLDLEQTTVIQSEDFVLLTFGAFSVMG